MAQRIIELPSGNQDPRPNDVQSIDTLVLHYTGMKSAGEALDRMRDPVFKVSAHWCIGEDGTVWRLVPEEMRAWHSGISYWGGRHFVNDFSIGIELVNPGHEFGYRPFPGAQMEALIELCLAIQARHPIRAGNVIGHADVAPLRKNDPGELFDWARLARAGIGVWPNNVAEPGAEHTTLEPGTRSDTIERQQAWLFDIGYGLHVDGHYGDETSAVVRAFQRHFRQAHVDGVLDGCTRAIIQHLHANR